MGFWNLHGPAVKIIELQEDKGQIAKCSECKFVTNKQDVLDTHLKRVHKHFINENQFKTGECKCDQCEYVSNNKNFLNTQIQKVHKHKYI